MEGWGEAEKSSGKGGRCDERVGVLVRINLIN
jgi:hypothetical protein